MRVSALRLSVRWLRAVDIPSSKPKIHGYKPQKQPKQYEAFSIGDSGRIETAWESLQSNTADRGKIAVEEDGLLTVDLRTLLCAPTYYDGPAFRVHRALWFEMLGNNRIAPISDSVQDYIETLWKAKTTGKFEIDLRGLENDEQKPFTAEFQGDKLIMWEKDSWLSAFKRRYLFRGLPKEDEMKGAKSEPVKDGGKVYATDESGNSKDESTKDKENSEDEEPKDENKGLLDSLGLNGKKDESGSSSSKRKVKVRPESRPRPIKHLVFCMHGIGQLLSVKFEQINFVKDVDKLRDMINKRYPKAVGEPASEPAEPEKEVSDSKRSTVNEGVQRPETLSDVQVLPVLWRNKLDTEINGINPGQLFGSENLAAEAVLDFVLYSSPSQRDKVLQIAVDEMNRMFKEFCELNPDFARNPRVSIIGHSLGAVISFDLISSDLPMEFSVENLFTLGSPLGVLNLIGGLDLESSRKPKSLYNIMRLSDPIATRLEPLVAPEHIDVMPKPLPGGGANILQQAKELGGDLVSQGELLANKASSVFQLVFASKTNGVSEKSESKDQRNQVKDLKSLRGFNRHGRIDFSVQETLDISLLLGLAGHLMYLDNPDVVQFMLKEILKKEHIL